MEEENQEQSKVTIERSELNKLNNSIKENTAALVEMGIALVKIKNKIELLVNKGAVRG